LTGEGLIVKSGYPAHLFEAIVLDGLDPRGELSGHISRYLAKLLLNELGQNYPTDHVTFLYTTQVYDATRA
jgi:hypothetical protein